MHLLPLCLYLLPTITKYNFALSSSSDPAVPYLYFTVQRDRLMAALISWHLRVHAHIFLWTPKNPLVPSSHLDFQDLQIKVTAQTAHCYLIGIEKPGIYLKNTEDHIKQQIFYIQK